MTITYPMTQGRAAPASPPVPVDRWFQLTEALLGLGQEPTVAARLRRTVEVAAEAVHARYAALVLRDVHGAVDRLVLSEPDPASVDVVRRRLARHHLGPPDGGEAADDLVAGLDLLEVPVRSDTGVSALYVLGSRVPGGFTTEDARLLSALAEATGAGMGCTALFEEAQVLIDAQRERARAATVLQDIVIARLFAPEDG